MLTHLKQFSTVIIILLLVYQDRDNKIVERDIDTDIFPHFFGIEVIDLFGKFQLNDFLLT